MFQKIKKLFQPAQPAPKAPEPDAAPEAAPRPPKTRKPRAPKNAELSPKEQATKRREPWHDVKLITNPADPRNGYFQMDWNSFHIEELRRLGYAGETDEDVIEGWIRDISRTVAMEDEEILDFVARPRVQSKRKDDGTTEYS